MRLPLAASRFRSVAGKRDVLGSIVQGNPLCLRYDWEFPRVSLSPYLSLPSEFFPSSSFSSSSSSAFGLPVYLYVFIRAVIDDRRNLENRGAINYPVVIRPAMQTGWNWRSRGSSLLCRHLWLYIAYVIALRVMSGTNFASPRGAVSRIVTSACVAASRGYSECGLYRRVTSYALPHYQRPGVAGRRLFYTASRGLITGAKQRSILVFNTLVNFCLASRLRNPVYAHVRVKV